MPIVRFLRQLKEPSLRQRFLIAPLLGLLLLSVVIAAFTYESRRQNALLTSVAEEHLVAYEAYIDLFMELSEQQVGLFELLNSAAQFDEETLYDNAKRRLFAIHEATRKLREALSTGDSHDAGIVALQREALALIEAYRKAVTSAVEMTTLNVTHAPRQIAFANQRFGAMNRAFEKLLDAQLEEIKLHVRQRVERNDERTILLALGGVALAVLLLVLSFVLSRLLSRSLEKQIGLLAELGDPEKKYPKAPGGDEVERIGSAIAEFRRTQQRIEALNRIHAVLSGINSTIVRVRDRGQLLEEACRIAVEAGRFTIAWIGMLDPQTRSLVPAAWHGPGREHADKVVLAVGEGIAQGDSLAAEAIRHKRAAISNDVAHDPRIVLRTEMSAHGLGAAVVLPLLVDGEVAGTLTLVAPETGFFDDEEMKLLQELAGDIAFALDHIAKSEKLEYLAYYDPLTGLANRTLFHERLSQAIGSAGRESHKPAVLLLNVDRFRTINETLGRAAGDELLKQIAARARRYVGDPGRLARLGADGFAAMVAGVFDTGGLLRYLEQGYREVFGEPFQLGDTALRVSARIGVALCPTDGDDADTLLRNAEAALKRVSASAEKVLFYAPQMTERGAENLTLENKLQQALEKDEFVLHYQPKVDVETRRIVGVEALIRWQSAELGLVSPGKFIPLLEETGLILRVGTWALRRAALEHRRWVELGLDAPRVAVNVSMVQLRQRGFVTAVEQAISEGVMPSGIDLEITESLVMQDIEANIQKLKDVRGLGLAIAIDDFGTGYSSLGYLAKLPVQTLKIDRSFITSMVHDADTLSLVRMIISLAHSLRLTVVAEGVETEEQVRMLRLLGCDAMQGYLFGKPVPFEAMTALLQTPQEPYLAAA